MKKTFFLAGILTMTALAAHAQDKSTAAKIPADVEKILQKNACLACHKVDAKVVGPSYQDVAKKKYTKEQIVELIKNPKPANWPGYPPMMPMAHVPKEDLLLVANWIVSLEKKK